MDNIFLFYTLLIILIIVIYSITNFFITKWFKYKTKRSTSLTFPIIKGLNILITAFVVKNGFGEQLLNTIIDLINKSTSINISLPSDSYSSVYAEIFFYFSVVVLLIFYSYFAFKKFKDQIIAAAELIPDKPKLEFPVHKSEMNPIFHERIKYLFELKFEKEKLKLEYDAEYSALFGKYSQGLHRYNKIIICEAANRKKTISIEEIIIKVDEVLEKMKSLAVIDDSSEIIELNYILEKGTIGGNSKKIILYTEDQFLNNLVSFDSYLEKMVFSFSNTKLPFSNPDKDYTLEDTFLLPDYTIGKKTKIKSNLNNYLDNWLRDSSLKHIVLLGDYGMGKSSYCKYYAVNLAKRILYDDEVLRFPVFISLTNTSPRHGGINNSIGNFVAENIGVSFKLFKELVERGKILFILDGFDEMGFVGTHEQRIKQLNAIWQLATAKNKLLISGRPSYFPNEEELKFAFNIKDDESVSIPKNTPYFERIYLSEFDQNKIEESLEKYYSKEVSKKYFDFIDKNSTILDLCKRPSMMHIVREMLPELSTKLGNKELTSSKLMDYYIDHWIERQIEKNIVSSIEDKTIKQKFVKNFFTNLAANYYQLNVEKLPADEIINFLQKELKNISFTNKEDIEGFESEILAGFFVEIENDEYKFVHKSFKEFFVAKKILNLLEVKNYEASLIVRRIWSKEIIDFIFDSDLLKRSNPKKFKDLPSLLTLTSRSEYSAKLKSENFKASIRFNNFAVQTNKFIFSMLFLPMFKILDFIFGKRQNPKILKTVELSTSIHQDDSFLDTFYKVLNRSIEIYISKLENEIGLTEKSYYIALLNNKLDPHKDKLIINYLEKRHLSNEKTGHNKVQNVNSR